MGDTDRVIWNKGGPIVFIHLPVQEDTNIRLGSGWHHHNKSGPGILPYGLTQIVDQVVYIFDADAQADKRIAQSILYSFFAGNRGMGHAGGVIDQGLYAAKRFSQRTNFDLA